MPTPSDPFVSSLKRNTASLQTIWRYARLLGVENIHLLSDRATGLEAIIVVHSTLRGPSMGGCRFARYFCYEDALIDALRLAYTMTLKNAAAQLPFGGGKTIILQPTRHEQREKLFATLGEWLNHLNGRHIIGADVGVDHHDMEVIAQYTPHTIQFSPPFAKNPTFNPAIYVAKGVFLGLQAAVSFALARDLHNIKVAVQGAGEVGSLLCHLLAEAGAKVWVADVIADKAKNLAESHCNILFAAVDKIYDIACDVFAPCAVSATIGRKEAQKIKCKVIAGGADNPFTHPGVANLLYQRQITYAPDFIINAGGAIGAAQILAASHCQDREMDKAIEAIGPRLAHIFELAAAKACSPDKIARQLALAHLLPQNDTHQDATC